MDEYKCFDVSLEKGVATVTLNRGEELNTMIPAFWIELPKIKKLLDFLKAKNNICTTNLRNLYFMANELLKSLIQMGNRSIGKKRV